MSSPQPGKRAPSARSYAEMRFSASLEPCPHCGRPPGDLELYGHEEAWALTGNCPRCATPRAFTFVSEGDPLKAPQPRRELGGRTPSRIIRVGQFLAELDRQLALVRPEPEELQPPEWRASTAALDRAITCTFELRKFIPDGADAIPDDILDDREKSDRVARGERYTAAWLTVLHARLLALDTRMDTDAPRIWAIEEAADEDRSSGASSAR